MKVKGRGGGSVGETGEGMDGSATQEKPSIIISSKGIHLVGTQTSSGTFLHEKLNTRAA